MQRSVNNAEDIRNLVVEVLNNRGNDKNQGWLLGSGFFVGKNLVLTAFHNVQGAGELFVRCIPHGAEKFPAKVLLQGDKDIDLAVLEVSNMEVDVPPLRYAEVDQSVSALVDRCWAIGFPRFMQRMYENELLRDSAQVDGKIPTGDHLKSASLKQPLLTLRVRNSPRPLPSGSVRESEWQGISGATVFSGNNIIVGVITEHHLPEGESALTVVPITALNRLPEPEATKWWKLLGMDHQALVRLPSDEREQRLRSLQFRRCDFYQYISLPVRYVSRREVLDTVRSALLPNQSDGTASSPSNRPLVLHGMGGIGKSIIARALCDDPAVQTAFPDGILWVTLGKKPELVQEMRQWVQALGGTISENAPTVNRLKDLLTKLLKDRTCLLIIDDVWRRSHAKAFSVGGPHCRMLLTTRDTEIVGALRAKVQSVPVMTEAEAIFLLEEWSDGHLTETDSKLKGQIVKRLGYLPLAVELAGAQLRWKQAEEWLQTFDLRKLKASRPEDIHDNLELTFNLSLDDLDEANRRLYVSLAIFKEDEATPQAGIERLWQSLGELDAASTTYLLGDLAARALLEVTSHQSPRVVRLHGLLHNLIDKELNDKRIAVHQALLGAYGAMRKGDGWHTVDDDGYLYDHLTYHLHATSAMKELEGLFVDQGWLHVRVPQRDYTYDGYLEDLTLVWEQATAETRRQIEKNQEPAGFAACMRYLLIRTSINSLSGNYLPELVARAVETGLWSPRRALSVAAKIPNEAQKGKMYTALLKTTRLSKEQREEAQRLGLEAVLTLLQELLQELVAWQAAASSQAQDVTLLQDPLQVLNQIGTMVKILADLPSQGLKLALEALSTLDERVEVRELVLIQVLTALAPRLIGEMQEQALQAALTLSDQGVQAQVLAALAPRLTGEMLEQALQAALALSDQGAQALALAALASQLPEERRAPVLERALQDALALSDQEVQAQVLAALAPRLTGEMLEQALQAALAPFDGWERAAVLAELASQLPELPELPEKQLEQAWEATLAIPVPHKLLGEHGSVLTTLASPLKGLNLASSFLLVQAQVLAALAPWLPEKQLERALQDALALSDQEVQAQVLAALAPWLPEKQLERALQDALALSDQGVQAVALATLASQLPEERRAQMLERALQDVLALSDELERAVVLAELAPRLPEKMQEQALALSNEQVKVIPTLPLVPDQVRSPQHLRQTMLDALLSMQYLSRRDILYSLFIKGLFYLQVFSSETLGAIASHLIEICEEWHWL